MPLELLEEKLLDLIIERAFQAATLAGSSEGVQTKIRGWIKDGVSLEQLNDNMGMLVEELRTQADEELRKRGA